jgi:hypothetical protein
MMLLENPLNASSLAYPLLESVHIIAFIAGVGTIALMDFRLLGIGLTTRSAAQLWRDTMPWTLAALSLVIFSGLLLFSLDPGVYYLNKAFLLKMTSLVLAIAFYYTLVRRSAMRSPALATRIIASISLVLWALVLSGGIFIGFIG